jgi:carboxylesterase type B
MLFGTLVGSEDCLFLNVYTQQLPLDTINTLKPVMVWIHGGGFSTGSSKSDLYGPEFLLTEDIVLVTINYRLGIFGFLSFEDASLEVPGNAGLKDMVMALKWVQKNISKFSGDPNNVTVFGESAGGMSVHYLVLSPLAAGITVLHNIKKYHLTYLK